MKLKYLFSAEYSDGSFYDQNAADKSILDPEKRSCFYDIENEKTKQLIRFGLTDGECVYLVNLLTGHFEINGIPFSLHPRGSSLVEYKLFFTRRHIHTFTQDFKETGHTVTYRLGWTSTDLQGQPVERIIEFD